MGDLNPETLLHLAALASGLSIAYVGLDKIHPADRKLDSEIESAAANWALLLQELELKGNLLDGDKLSELYNINAMHLLYFISTRVEKRITVKTKEVWRPYVIWILCQYNFPFMPYFRKKIDLTAITFFALMATVGLILLSSRGLFPYVFFESRAQLRWLFWFYSVNILWVFISAASSAKLFSIKKTCAKLEEKVRSRVKGFNLTQINEVSKILADAAKRV